MLTGEPGIGKTSIAKEFTEYALALGAKVLWGRCYESIGMPSYWPWVQAIRSYIRDHDPELLRFEIGTGATEDSVLSGLPLEVFQAIKDWHEGDWTPKGRLGTPADMGNAVGLFCSEDASWITGQTIMVDGGASLMDPVFSPAIQRG